MAASVIGKLLIDGLTLSNADKATQAMAYILLRTDEQKLKMCEFLPKNHNATNEEIDAETRRLYQTSMMPRQEQYL